MVVIKPNRQFTTISDSALRSEWRRSSRRSRPNTYPESDCYLSDRVHRRGLADITKIKWARC